MTDLERRHRKATDKIARWCSAANNAKAMGDKNVMCDGRKLLVVVQTCLVIARVTDHDPHCRCESCVAAWEAGAGGAEAIGKFLGVDLKKHSFGALQRAAQEHK
jgi:hypothetical protein